MSHRETFQYRSDALVGRLAKRQILALMQGSSLEEVKEIERLVSIHLDSRRRGHLLQLGLL